MNEVIFNSDTCDGLQALGRRENERAVLCLYTAWCCKHNSGEWWERHWALGSAAQRLFQGGFCMSVYLS